MVDFPPLMPSARWFSRFLHSGSQGFSLIEAFEVANETVESPREFGRYSLVTSGGPIVTLPIAVKGGGRQLRDFGSISRLQLSEHGNWRKTHLGAIEANMGRAPFYRNLEPALSRVYRDTSLSSLRDFNLAIFRTLLSFLLGDISFEELNQFYGNPVLKTRGEEIAECIIPEHSILPALATYGRETLLGLLARP
ncbi:MAG: WbqC family protein [Muribaculaceae bacterium]|nr:WbqC family protein [Muribaculaceae bacterium]